MKVVKSMLVLILGLLLVGCEPPTKDEPPIQEFKIITVGSHIETQTNNLGGVVRQDRMLDFTFLDSEGKAISKSRYLEGTSIYLSKDGNSRVIQQGSNITLYLVEEMMNKLY